MFSSRWIQPERKGCPTTPSHPEVIIACSSPSKPKSYFCCYYPRAVDPPPLLFPWPLHTSNREKGRVTWEYVCGGGGGGWECRKEMHLAFYIAYILRAIACLSYSPPVLVA